MENGCQQTFLTLGFL